jgi:hypothetical protein
MVAVHSHKHGLSKDGATHLLAGSDEASSERVQVDGIGGKRVGLPHTSFLEDALRRSQVSSMPGQQAWCQWEWMCCFRIRNRRCLSKGSTLNAARGEK